MRSITSSARHGLLLLRRNLIVGCEHCAAAIGELRRVLPQAGDDTVYIRDLPAAQTPDIRRASHLLFPRAAIFSCISRANARQCHRSKARDQARSVQFAYPRPPCLTNSSSTNEAREGSWPTTKCESHSTRELEPTSPCRNCGYGLPAPVHESSMALLTLNIMVMILR